MKSKKTRSVMNCLLILIIALMTSQGVIGMEQANLLWYEQPANK